MPTVMDSLHSDQSPLTDNPKSFLISAMDRLCECLLNPATIIRSVLRTLQGEATSTITDSGFNDIDLPTPVSLLPLFGMFLFFMSFVSIMFATRPASLRRSERNGSDKPSYMDNHPPTPPPSVG